VRACAIAIESAHHLQHVNIYSQKSKNKTVVSGAFAQARPINIKRGRYEAQQHYHAART